MEWSSDLAYAIGLITTDGSLSIDGRHINLTSKDIDQVETFARIKYSADFLRGHLDGDGFTYSYWDKRWKSSFMLYTGFISASKLHIEWIRDEIQRNFNLKGAIKFGARTYKVMYAKKSSIILLNILYYQKDLPCLQRKRFKIEQAFAILK